MSLWSDIMLSRKPLAGFLVIGCTWAACFAQMPAIKQDIGASDGDLGAAILIASLGALAAMWLAPVADRLAGRWAMGLFALLIAVGMLIIGVAPGLVVFTLGMTFASVGSGVVDVLVNVRVSEIEEQSRRKLMNLNHALYSFTYAGAAAMTGQLRELGWQPLQVFMVLAVVIAALAACSITPRRAPLLSTETPSAEGMPHLLVWLAGLLVMVAFLTEASAEGWSALHLERTLGGGAAQGAMGPAILGLTMGIGRLAGHSLLHRVPDMGLLVVACLLTAVGLFVAGMAPTLAVAFIGFGLSGLGVSVVAPVALALVGRVVPARARLAAISRASVLGYGAFFLGPPLMGFTSELFGLRAGFMLIGLIMVLAAVILIPALARHSSSQTLTRT